MEQFYSPMKTMTRKMKAISRFFNVFKIKNQKKPSFLIAISVVAIVVNMMNVVFGQISIPYNENFSSITVANGFPTVTGGAWARSGTTTLQPTYIANQTTYNRSGNADTKFMSFRYGQTAGNVYTVGPFNLTAGVTYNSRVLYKADGIAGFGPLSLTYGTAATLAAQTNTIASVPANITNANYADLNGNFTVPTTGAYYIGIRCVASSAPWYLTVDDFSLITVVPCSGTPTPGNTVATPAAVPPSTTTTLTLQNATPGTGLIYQWQSGPSSTGPWTNVGTSSPTFSPTITAPTWFRCVVYCGVNAGTSNPTLVDFGPCVPTSSSSYYLTNVTTTGGITNFTNPTGLSAGGYGSYYNSVAVSQYPGMSFNVTLNSIYSSDYFHLWVDWNNDYDFADAGEAIFLGSSYIASANITVNIPAGQTPGDYRMRCANGYFGAQSSCGPSTSAEYEDYKITVVAPPPCAGTPTPGNTVASVTSCPPGTSINLSLQTPTIGTGVTYQWQSAPSSTGPWTNVGASAATLSQVISANIWYRCIVACSAGTTGTSNPVQITLGQCVPTGFTTSSSYYISNFTTTGGVSNITNASVASASGGYSNFSNLICSQVTGANITFNITPNLGTHYFYIWVDWNDDYDFLDANEAVYTGTGYLANLSLLYTIPGSVAPGNHRVRIANNYIGTIASSCGPATYGEFEDYTILVIPPPTSPAINAAAYTTCAAGVSLIPVTAPQANEIFYWQTSATGTATTNNANPYVVYGNGTYYLRAYNSLYNLWATASTSIVVSAFPTVTPPTAIIVSSPSCPSASLTMGAAPSGTNYYWQGTNSAGFSTTSNATAAYTASTTGTYYVRAKDANDCWSDNTSSLVTIYTSPNATANFVAPTTCGTNGQIVFNVQGSGTVFLSDFGTNTLPAGTVSAGNDFNPSVNGRMQLTSPAGSKNGGVVIPNNTGIASNDFQIDFDFVTISAGVAAADGFSYSYGPDVVALPNQTAVQTALGAAPATGVATLCPENGSGTGLKLAFDAYSNTGGCPVANGAAASGPNTSVGNSPGVYLMYNSTSLHQGSSCPGVLYYSNNTTWAASGIAGNVTSTHVTIKINAAGAVSMWQNGVQVVNNVSLGAGYLAADKSTWKHAFTARTGGLYEGHYIDNLDIHYNLYEYSIDNGATWTTQNPIPVPIGMYQTKVRYAGVTNGCETAATIGLASNGGVNVGTSLINGSPTANICSGTNFTVMTANLPNAGGGFTYQWQSSTNNGATWTNVGTLMIAYIDLTTSATQNTLYRLQVICPTVTTYSSVASVTIFQTPSFTLSASNNGIWCDNYTGAQTVTASNSGITYAWSPAASLSAATGQTVTSTIPAGTQATYTVVGTNVAGCASTQSISVGLPYINVTSNVSNFCGSGGAAVLTATTNAGANASFTWSNLSPTTATMTPNGATANVNITATSNFQVSIASYNGNAGCASVGNFSLGVYPLPSATVTTTASGVCPGTSAVINSGLSSGNFSAVCTPYVNYAAPSNATYLANTGIAQVALASGSLDDGGWSGIPLGFNFNFFGTTYNSINVGTNGVLQFGAYNATALGDFTIGALPNTVDPLGAIYICANDLVEYNTNNYVRYWTDGFAPNRRFIIEYYASQFGNAANNVRAKAVLYETIGVVDIQGIEIMSTNSKSIGVNNATGTVGAAAPNCPANTPNYWSGQTATIPAASPQAWRFTPPANYSTVWTATAGGTPIVVASGTNIFSLNVAPTVTTNYSISYTNQTTGCTNAPGSAQVTMAVLGVVAPSGVNALTSNALVCPNDPFTLSTNYTGIVDGLTYQWQSAPSATGPWTDIFGATASTSVQNMTATTYYRCNIQSCGGTAVPTAAVLVTYNTNCIAVPATGNNSITTCSGVIFDNGGLNGNYAASSNGYTVIYPSTPGYMVQIQGSQVTESSYDYLQIYNGVGTAGTQMYNFSGTANVGPFTSTTGPLTVNFYADPSVQYAGFSLTSTCIPPTPAVTSNISNGNICIGSPITMTAAITVPGTVYWFAGGCATTGQVGTGLSLTVSPTTTTTYYARLFDGSIWSNCSSYTVVVNTYPIVNAGLDVNLCNNTTTQLNGTVTNATAPGTFTQTYSGSGTDNTNFFIGGVTTGAPAGAVITSITYTANIGIYCALYNWYSWGLYVNGTYVTAGCDGTFTYNGLNGLPANGQLIQISSIDNDAFGDFVTMGLTVTVNYSYGASTVVWTPSTGLSSTTILNPVAGPTTTTNYTMSVTSAQGCTSTDQVLVTVIPAPANGPITGPTSVCAGSTVNFSNSVAGGTWSSSNASVVNMNSSNGSGVGSTAGTATISYTTNGANGCTTTTTANLAVVALPVATITANGPTAFCQGGSVTLTASPAASYLWNNNATTQSITVSTSGSYSVEITNASGCTSAISAPTVVTVNALPVAAIAANGSTVFCQGGSVDLTATGGSTYVWSNTLTGSTLSANTSGNYFVTVTNANGCQAVSNTVSVTVNPAPVAAITANGPTTFCQGNTVVLTAAGNGAIVWTNNQTSPSITVSASGSYGYTITGANGCSSTATPTVVSVATLPVVPAITGANNVCLGASTLYANTVTGGTWSSSNTAIAAVDALGTVSSASVGSATISYQVGLNGCATTVTKVINVQATPVATISAIGSTSFCQGANVTLVSSPGASYLWSNNATSQNVTLSTAGPITVQVTGTNGCSATSAPQTITVNPLPVLDPIAGASLVCVGSTGTITNTTAGGSWSSANANVAVVNALTGLVSGNTAGTANMTYSYTNANGCSAAVSAPVVVQALPNAATTVAGSTVFCQGGSVTISAPTAASYLWTPSGATTQSISATAGGTYSVQVTNGACSATSPVTVVTVHALPTASIASTSTSICQGGSVTLTAAPATLYAWTNGATTQSITVTAAGNYGLTVSNVYGCTSTAAPLAINVSSLPTSYISAAGPTTFCNGNSVVLSANAGTSYVWSNGATTQNITATTAGLYFVTITNAAGCSSVSNEISVTTQQAFGATATAVGPTAVCSGAYVTLVASPGSSYLWSNGATTQGINAGVNGNYSVTVTNALGCTSTSAVVPVSILPAPTAGITTSGATTFCEGGSVVLTGTGGNTYIWNSNYNGSTITATQAGTYVVTAYAANGCSDAAEVVVNVNEVPSGSLILDGNTVLCPGESLVISAQPNNTYSWSNTATTQSITVTSPGTYSAVLTGLNGCTSNSDVVTVTAGAATSSTINATAYSSYVLNEVIYTQSGTYTQTMLNAAGCDSTITLNLTLTVGIEEGSIADVKLYPNPTSESFTIQTSAPVYGTFSIVDAQGKIVFAGEMTGTETSVNISSVARGIYYLRIPEMSEPLRVVKN